MSSGAPREDGTHDPLSRRALAAWRTAWSTTGRGQPGLNVLHSAILFCILLLGSRTSLAAEPETKPAPRIAAIVTTYYHNSHADLLVGRLLETSTLDGQGERPRMQLVSLYTDQIDAKDKSRALAAQHGFKIYDSIAGALTLGGDALAVDGVLLVAEHGNYPESATGQFQFPKRRFFDEVAAVFEKSGRSVPIFFDKHLADNWADARHIYDTAARLKVPMLAGSSIAGTWRDPAVDVRRDAPLKQVVVLSYHRLDSYGFHALEIAQCLAERRQGGETGVKSVQCFTDDAVWAAGQRGEYDAELYAKALAAMKFRPLPADKTVAEVTPNPVLWTIDYRDGLRVNIFTLNNAVAEWTAAWRYVDTGAVEATQFRSQDVRPLFHFWFQLQAVDELMLTGKSAWPVQRTLLTTGLLDTLLVSKLKNGQRIDTPFLDMTYKTSTEWRQPKAAPQDRPLDAQ